MNASIIASSFALLCNFSKSSLNMFIKYLTIFLSLDVNINDLDSANNLSNMNNLDSGTNSFCINSSDSSNNSSNIKWRFFRTDSFLIRFFVLLLLCSPFTYALSYVSSRYCMSLIQINPFLVFSVL